MDRKDIHVHIPLATWLSTVGVFVGLWLFWLLRDIVILFLIVVAIVIAFSPIVKSWSRVMPRTLAITLLYLSFIGAFGIILALLVPPVVSQLSDFLVYAQSLVSRYGVNENLLHVRDNLNLLLEGRSFEAISSAVQQFSGSVGAVYSTTVGFIGGLVALVTIFVTSFYLLLDEKQFHAFIAQFIPNHRHAQVSNIVDGISTKMGGWLRGQLTLMVIIGIVSGTALAILGVPYALLLGVWAGIMELIPFIGPILGAVPGVFLAFTTLGPVNGAIALLIYLVIQQIENQFLVPKVMGKALGLSPVTIIFSLLIGGKLLGLIGVLIAVPLAAALSVIYQEWHHSKRAS